LFISSIKNAGLPIFGRKKTINQITHAKDYIISYGLIDHILVTHSLWKVSIALCVKVKDWSQKA